jgi:hypothetical protein
MTAQLVLCDVRTKSLHIIKYILVLILYASFIVFFVLEMIRDHTLQRRIWGRYVLSIVTSIPLCQNTIWREGKGPMTLSTRHLMEVRGQFHASTTLSAERYSSVTAW